MSFEEIVIRKEIVWDDIVLYRQESKVSIDSVR